MSPSSIDALIVSGAQFADNEDLRQAFSVLRREDPVHWTEPLGHRPFWTITRHEDIVDIERRSDVFLNAPRNMLHPVAYEERLRQLTGGEIDLLRPLTLMDAPDHRRYRDITQARFVPKGLETIRADIQRFADEAIELLRQRGSRCEFVREIALSYPLRALAALLGLPEEEGAELTLLTNELIDAQEQMASDESADAGEAFWRLYQYFVRLCRQRRGEPSEDMASAIARATIDGKLIDEHEVVSYYMLLVTAGHETTASSLSSGVMLLGRHPEELAKLKRSPELLSATVQEIVRWTSPIKHFFRTAREDAIVGGRHIKAGDSLLLHFAAANRDESVYRDPDRFQIDRERVVRHVGFGAGVHVCLGQHLARYELEAMISRLAKGLKSWSVEVSTDYVCSNFLSGLKSLYVQYAFESTIDDAVVFV